MKRCGSILLVLATCWLAAAGNGEAQSEATPALTVEESRIDLGEIKSGSEAVATFVFHNSGEENVKIIRAKPS